MTTDQLITGIQQRVVNLTNAVFTAAWYLDRANQGYRQLVTFYDVEMRRPLRFPHFQTTRDKVITGGSNLYVIPDADIFSVTSMWDLTNGREIEEKSIRELETSDPTVVGTLQKYAIVGTGVAQALRLYAIPSAATTVRLGVYLYPETLAIGGAGPTIPEAWHRAVELFAASDAADKLALPDRRDALYNQAVNAIRSTRSPTQETRRRRRHITMWPVSRSGSGSGGY